MGAYIYKVTDRVTGEVLFTGREGETAKYLGCSQKYVCKLGQRNGRPGKGAIISYVNVSREWTEIPVYCLDCGVEIQGAGPRRERCDECRKKRNIKASEAFRENKKQGRKNVIECATSRAQLQKDCIGCFYYGGENYINRTCNYIFIEGHSRGCPPGAACTKRKEWEKK